MSFYQEQQRRQRAFADGASQPIAPRRQGLRPGDLDPLQPINRGIVFALGAHPAASPLLGLDLVGRQPVTLTATADLTAVHPDVALWRSVHIDADGDEAEWRSAKLRAIGPAFTIAVYLSVTTAAFDVDAIVLVVPWVDDSWSTPFYTIGLRNDSATASLGAFTDGTTLFTGVNAAGDAWADDGNPHWIVCTRAGATMRIYFDGTQQGGDITVNAANVGWNGSGSRRVVLAGRPGGTQNLTNADYHSASIWQRELSAAEVASLDTNPTVQFIGGS